MSAPFTDDDIRWAEDLGQIADLAEKMQDTTHWPIHQFLTLKRVDLDDEELETVIEVGYLIRKEDGSTEPVVRRDGEAAIHYADFVGLVKDGWIID